LDGTYERTLLDIDDENWAFAHRLFHCIVVARRPLRVEELAEFLAFKSDTGGSLTFEGNWRPESPKDMVLSTCSSLVAVVNVDGSPVIQFSHFSVKEYLTSSRITEGRVSRYYIALEPAHIFVTQACLCLLLQLDKHVTKKNIEEFPLARYASQYWTDHAEFGNVSSHAEDMIKRVFKPENHHFTNWVWIYDTISHRSLDSEGPSHPKWAPLHYAAQHGFLRVIEWLITTRSQDVDVSSYDSSTPLHIASKKGLFMVAEILLAHHANSNARNHIDWTPLHFASRFEHPKLARLLLEHGAVVDSKTWLRVTPLSLLLDNNGNLEVAQLLLEHGADPNVRSGTGRDSLYRALKNGQLDLVQLLVKHGTDLNTRDVDGQTLLHMSSQRGDRKVAQELLILDVDIHSRDNRGRTPLQVALEGGNDQVVQLLLQYGAKRPSPLRRGDTGMQVRVLGFGLCLSFT
jgi:ankyrin repeat protein